MLQHEHLRLIDKCGLYMYKIFFLFKFSGCGLYSGALNSPKITVKPATTLNSPVPIIIQHLLTEFVLLPARWQSCEEILSQQSSAS